MFTSFLLSFYLLLNVSCAYEQKMYVPGYPRECIGREDFTVNKRRNPKDVCHFQYRKVCTIQTKGYFFPAKKCRYVDFNKCYSVKTVLGELLFDEYIKSLKPRKLPDESRKDNITLTS